MAPDEGDVVGSVDLDALFAPPTELERAAVEASWAARDTPADGVREEEARHIPFPGGGFHARVVSHVVDGHRHYGAILEPAEPPAAQIPVLMYAHGGDGGTSVDEVVLLAAALGLSARDYVLVAPSFRSEPLRFGSETWQSEGSESPWDRDVDDALALLEVTLATVPVADAERLGVVGLSRGGTVGLLMGIREPRVRAVVSFFAPTDFFGPFVRGVVRNVLLDASPRDLPGLDALSREFIRPLQEGDLTMEEARLELLRRSPARFADRLPAVQIHHGTADEVVPVEEAEHLEAAMDALGRGPPGFETHIYAGAGHNPLEMPQSPLRARAFLAGALADFPLTAQGATGVRSIGKPGRHGPRLVEKLEPGHIQRID